MSLSLALLAKAHPFWQLELMHFAEIFFEDPQRLMKLDKIGAIATEWRRTFCKLRGMPCPADVYFTYMQEDYLDEESDGDGASVSADEEMSDSSEGSEGGRAGMSADEEISQSVNFDEYEFSWFILRTKLWKILGYPVIRDTIQNLW
jgi:hypothetical protein